MKVTLEPTDEFYVGEDFSVDGRVMLRKWSGMTDAGVPIHAYVATISPQTHDEADLAAFEAEFVGRQVILNPQEGGSV